MPTTRVNDLDIYHDTFGDPSSSTVLLVSGLGAQCVVYEDEFCELIAGAGHHVVRYDNRDVGLSTHLDGDQPDVVAAVIAASSDEPVDAAYTLSDMAADGMGLLDALGIDDAHVLGSSMGGMIAQTMAIEHPQRVRSLTSLYSTTGEPDVGTPDPEVLASMIGILTPQETREGRIASAVELARIIGTPDEFDEARATTKAAFQTDRSYDPAGTSRQFMAILASGSRADALPSLRLPTMVLHGDRDRLVQISGGERTAELIPGARMRVLEGMGHDMPPAYWDRIVAGLLDNVAVVAG